MEWAEAVEVVVEAEDEVEWAEAAAAVVDEVECRDKTSRSTRGRALFWLPPANERLEPVRP